MSGRRPGPYPGEKYKVTFNDGDVRYLHFIEDRHTFLIMRKPDGTMVSIEKTLIKDLIPYPFNT